MLLSHQRRRETGKRNDVLCFFEAEQKRKKGKKGGVHFLTAPQMISEIITIATAATINRIQIFFL